jgi:hypothetical protein
MFPGSLPFDYLRHLDRYDRIRRTRAHPTGSPVRRPVPREEVNT